ncbi:MAG: hypothetical protein ACREEX_05190, partial [Caulobacteraceae bacterium]
TLSLAAEGPMFVLLVGAPDFPQDRASHGAILSFDGKSPVTSPALGDGGMMGIRLGRGDAAKTTAEASSVSVTVDGHTHIFNLRNVAAALDAVARCAGQPTLSEQVDQPPPPIAGAGRWRLLVTLPGTPGRACAARVAGDQIDTLMLLNNAGDLVLIGGHSNWATWGGDVRLQLAIDGSPPINLTAATADNLILTLVKDPALLARLRRARTLDWTIPTGHVRGDVAGLGVALDAIKACRAQAQK